MSSLFLSIQVIVVGHPLSLFVLTNAGKTKDDEDVSGTITVPEVAHDTEENEYVVRLAVPFGRLVRLD
jgi:hypothetical protein